MSELTHYSDREIALLMRESVGRLFRPNALTREAIRDLYDEYRTRSDDSKDNVPSRRYRGSGK